MATVVVPPSIPFDGKTNATMALNDWINAGTNFGVGDTVMFQPGGKYLIGGDPRTIGNFPTNADIPFALTNFPNTQVKDPVHGTLYTNPIPADVLGKPIPADLLGPIGSRGFKLGQGNFPDIVGLDMSLQRGFGRGVQLRGVHDVTFDGTNAQFIMNNKFGAPVGGATGWLNSGQTPNWGFNNNTPFTNNQIFEWGIISNTVFRDSDCFDIRDNTHNVTFRNIFIRGGQYGHQTMIASVTENQHFWFFQGDGIHDIEIKNGVFWNSWADIVLYQPTTGQGNPGPTNGVFFHDNVISGVGRQGATPRAGGFVAQNNTWNDLTRWNFDITGAPEVQYRKIWWIGNTWCNGDDPAWRNKVLYPGALGQEQGYGDHEGNCFVDDLRIIGETIYRDFKWAWDYNRTGPIGSKNTNWIIANNTMPFVFGFDGNNVGTYPDGIRFYGDEVQGHDIAWERGPNDAWFPNVEKIHIFGNNMQGYGTNGYFFLDNCSGAVHDNQVAGISGNPVFWNNYLDPNSVGLPSMAGLQQDSNNKSGPRYTPATNTQSSLKGAWTAGTPSNVHFAVPGADGASVDVTPGQVVKLGATASAATVWASFFQFGLFEMPATPFLGAWFVDYTVPSNTAIGTNIPFSFIAYNFTTDTNNPTVSTSAGGNLTLHVVPASADTTPPIGDNTHTLPYVTLPAGGAQVGPLAPGSDGTNNVSLLGIATDNESGIASTNFLITGPAGYSISIPGQVGFGYFATWDVTGLPSGSYTIQLKATNGVGLSSTGPANIFTLMMPAPFVPTEAWNIVQI